MGSRKNYERLYELAELMGAAVAASRAAVAAGFAGYDRQVGQTGVSVRPELYITFGISGAVQHLSGITGAKKIIAVNSDPRAPIHQYSDLSVIADCNQTIDRLIDKLKNG
jgi:electron transfer flavoprotein alpha subunit